MPMPSLHLSSSARQAVVVAILVILSSFGVGVVRLAWMDLSLRALAAEEQARVDNLRQEISQTEKDVTRAKTDDYVKDWARQVAKQTLAGEIPVVLVAPSAAQPPSRPAIHHPDADLGRCPALACPPRPTVRGTIARPLKTKRSVEHKSTLRFWLIVSARGWRISRRPGELVDRAGGADGRAAGLSLRGVVGRAADRHIPGVDHWRGRLLRRQHRLR